MTSLTTATVFVLANKSPQRVFVRWHQSLQDAHGLFDVSIKIGDNKESVVLFPLEVQVGQGPDAIRLLAEQALESGTFKAIRSYSPDGSEELGRV